VITDNEAWLNYGLVSEHAPPASPSLSFVKQSC
jgi:hypothetical protein